MRCISSAQEAYDAVTLADSLPVVEATSSSTWPVKDVELIEGCLENWMQQLGVIRVINTCDIISVESSYPLKAVGGCWLSILANVVLATAACNLCFALSSRTSEPAALLSLPF